MKAIIDNLLYDTEKADLIYSVRRKVLGAAVVFCPGYRFTEWHSIDICKTKSGKYFEHDKDKGEITLTNEETVKGIISRLDPDKYIELYGAIQEA